MAFPHGADVAVGYGAVEGDAVAVVPLHTFQAPSIEVAQPPVPKLGVGHRVHRLLGGAIGIYAQVLAVENEDNTIPCRCLHREEVAPNRGYN